MVLLPRLSEPEKCFSTSEIIQYQCDKTDLPSYAGLLAGRLSCKSASNKAWIFRDNATRLAGGMSLTNWPVAMCSIW